MKILLAHRQCRVSGVETWMAELSRSYRALGHECELFFFDRGLMASQLPADCSTHFGGLDDCLALVAQRRFDVVQAEATDWEVGIAVVRRLAGSTKLVITAQTAACPVWTSANCDALVACSGWVAREQQALTDIPVQHIPNAVDTTAFSPGNGRDGGSPIIAWVGRGSDLASKRIDRFAAIGPAVARAGFRVWLADPDGPQRVPPEAAEALLPIVDFWGFVPRHRMPAFFRRVAASGGCVVSTSRAEGLPFALLEAQACGCPVVGPNAPGVNECVEPAHGGVLYPLGLEAADLAGLILDAISDRGAMQWRREACVRYIRGRFGLQRMAQGYLRVYAAAPFHPVPRVREPWGGSAGGASAISTAARRGPSWALWAPG
jgi:glycosyltransferase involved in cell wall biosynthesis